MERLFTEMLESRDVKEKALDDLVFISQNTNREKELHMETKEALHKTVMHQEELEIKSQEVDKVIRDLDNQIQEMQVKLKNKETSLSVVKRALQDTQETIQFKNSIILNLCEELVHRVGNINNREANLFYAMTSEFSTM